MKRLKGGGAALNKPKNSVIYGWLLAAVLLAAVVCMLHWVNAVSLRGTVLSSDYVLTDGKAEDFMVMIDDPWQDGSIVHIHGALLRLNQQVGGVNVRVGLVPEQLDAQQNAAQEVILLNTQLIRCYELAREYECDDHCGFHASVTRKFLGKDNAQYCVVLVDETDGAKRMVETGLTVMLIEGGLAFVQKNAPEEEAQHDQ